MDMSRHPSADGAPPTEAPACAGEQATPNLPALITALPGDPGSGPGASTRAPQTEFTRARQVLFLENLSITGSVRSAAAAGGVSHQTAYRARRSQRPFRLAWDAALVLARTHAEGTLACRAIDGVEEKVFYHGEEVATRTRYSDRLLLAHLARLDKLTADERVNAVAEDFDAALARFEAGEEVLVEAPAPAGETGAGEGENFSPGPCNTRSKSYTPDIDDWHPDDLADAMTLARPDDAPPLELLGDPDEVAACQRDGFLWGNEEWWTIGEDFISFIRDAAGNWVPDPEELAMLAREAEDDAEREGGERRHAGPGEPSAAPVAAAAPEGEERAGDAEPMAREEDREPQDEEDADDARGETDREAESSCGDEPARARAGEGPPPEPAPEQPPEQPPEQAPEPEGPETSPEEQAGGHWKRPFYMGTHAVNDGRLQPFYGRQW